jgi:CcmD family protein
MTAYGKIFVVIAVLSIILVGIFFYLFVIDRKLNKLKKEVEEKMSHQRK